MYEYKMFYRAHDVQASIRAGVQTAEPLITWLDRVGSEGWLVIHLDQRQETAVAVREKRKEGRNENFAGNRRSHGMGEASE